jgi:hypothetical protein
MIQRCWPLLAVWMALAAASAPAVAQPQAGPVPRVVTRHWSDVPGDTVALRELLEASWETGGETVMRGALRAAADPGRPYEVRLHALSGLAEFMARESGRPSLAPMRAAGERGLAECRPSTTWRPGDTIRSCTFPSITHGRSTHPRYGASTSIHPRLRDTIRATVQGLAIRDPDPRVRGAAAILWRAIGRTERWNASITEECRRLFAAPEAAAPPPSSADPFFRYMYCEQTGPVVLARAWRSAAVDSVHVVPLLRATQTIRDRRLKVALQEVAADTTRAMLTRRAALTALATLADGRMHAYDVAADDTEHCGARGFWMQEQEEGGEPMGPDAYQEIREFLWTLADESEAETPLARLAENLASCLSDLSHIPLVRP